MGWLGSILLAFCAVPEVISSIRSGKCNLTWPFLLLWYFGELFILIEVYNEIKEPFLLFNYGFNIILISILIYYKGKTNGQP